MDMDSSKLLNITLVQVTETQGNSSSMEAFGYAKSMDKLINSGLKINICATDRHIQIRKIHREKYAPKGIKHEFDVYHLSNSIRKKLTLLAKKKRFKDLAPWVKSVTNHLWWCAASSNGNADELVEKWLSITEHIKNVHSFRKNKIYKKCSHSVLRNYESGKKK
jgi:solute carrier family 8 (sodium/calcium exchanger)